MRPILLVMKAFGSYGRETQVEFDKLKSGIYLITGDTGAGKTTIFDAMTFALYGVASGSDRSIEMFHSDYAPKSEDTVVTLDFEHNGKKYTVERKIHYSKKRGTEEYKLSTDRPATLWEEDHSVTEKAKAVNDRVAEILGLDANQFRQIIVLAQGEFKKFLKSDSSGKADILGKLFDNRSYLLFQERLKKAASELNKKMEADKKKIENVMEDFIRPEDLEEEDLRFLHSEPKLLENLEELIQSEREQLSLLREQEKKISAKLDELKTEKNQIETKNRALDNLDKLRENKAKLAEQKEEIDELNVKRSTVEKAYYKVKPVDEACKRAEINYRENIALLEEKQCSLNEGKKVQKEIATKAEVIPELEKENGKIALEIKELEESIHGFEAYVTKKKELDGIQERVTQLEQSKQQIELELEDNRKQETELAEKIADEKKVVDTEAEKKAEYDKKCQRVEDVSELKGVMQSLTESIHSFEEQADEFKHLERETIAKADQHNVLYKQFIRGQAGTLAVGIKEEIEEKGESSCPVCRTILHHNNIVQLAVPEGKSVTQEMVEQAKSELEVADKEFRLMNEERARLEVAITEEKKGISERFSKIGLSNVSYEIAMEQSLIEKLENECMEDKLKSKQEYDLVLTAKAQYEKDLQLSENIKEEWENLLKRKEENYSSYTEKVSILSSKKAEVQAIQERLKGDSLDELNSKKADLLEQQHKNSDTINQINKEKETNAEKVSALEGEVKTLSDNDSKFEKNWHEAEAKRKVVIEEAKFDSYEDYCRVLENIPKDTEQWLENSENQINGYRENVKSNQDQLLKAEEECRDYKRVDLSELNELLSDTEDESRRNNDEILRVSSVKDSHEGTYASVSKCQTSIQKYSPAFEKLEQLSKLANGDNSIGGKLSFDRYAMANKFREILAAANIRLNVMSGGKYELVHQMVGGKMNTAAGLDIDIKDIFTGEQRKTDSISGGESFQVSMALALGLSDVVQAHANGQKIESMYIDEGFGSLDDGVLEKAINVLKGIAGENRQIGIISHVAKLEEFVDQKIVVTSSKKGSELKIVV